MFRLAQFALVGLLAGGILLILICPQPHLSGSFQATHGPTVTLRSLRSLLLLMLAIAAAASLPAGHAGFSRELAPSTSPVGLSSVLLC